MADTKNAANATSPVFSLHRCLTSATKQIDKNPAISMLIDTTSPCVVLYHCDYM